MRYFLLLIGFLIFGAFNFVLGCVYSEQKPKKKRKPSKWIHCFNCEIEMPAKKHKGQLYCANCKLIHNVNTYSIKEECKHPNRLTQALNTFATCETTIEVCADCNQPLTEPKTDCV